MEKNTENEPLLSSIFYVLKWKIFFHEKKNAERGKLITKFIDDMLGGKSDEKFFQEIIDQANKYRNDRRLGAFKRHQKACSAPAELPAEQGAELPADQGAEQGAELPADQDAEQLHSIYKQIESKKTTNNNNTNAAQLLADFPAAASQENLALIAAELLPSGRGEEYVRAQISCTRQKAKNPAIFLKKAILGDWAGFCERPRPRLVSNNKNRSSEQLDPQNGEKLAAIVANLEEKMAVG